MNIPKTKEDFIVQVSNLDQAWEVLHNRNNEYLELKTECERLQAQVKYLSEKKPKKSKKVSLE